MKITRHENDNGKYAKVYFPDESHWVDVRKHIDFDGDWEPATVNWSAMGDVSPDRAEAMAKTLAKAAEIAREFEGSK